MLVCGLFFRLAGERKVQERLLKLKQRRAKGAKRRAKRARKGPRKRAKRGLPREREVEAFWAISAAHTLISARGERSESNKILAK